MAYAPQAWRDFAVTTGGLAGALTGLLFVAVSLHSGALNRSRSLASRAAQTLVLFVTPAIAAVYCSRLRSPVRPWARNCSHWRRWPALCCSSFYRRAGHDGGGQVVVRHIERASPNLVTAVLVAVAGVSFLLKAGGGLYWMIPAVLAGLVGGVTNAWLFLLKIPDD